MTGIAISQGANIRSFSSLIIRASWRQLEQMPFVMRPIFTDMSFESFVRMKNKSRTPPEGSGVCNSFPVECKLYPQMTMWSTSGALKSIAYWNVSKGCLLRSLFLLSASNDCNLSRGSRPQIFWIYDVTIICLDKNFIAIVFSWPSLFIEKHVQLI